MIPNKLYHSFAVGIVWWLTLDARIKKVNMDSQGRARLPHPPTSRKKKKKKAYSSCQFMPLFMLAPTRNFVFHIVAPQGIFSGPSLMVTFLGKLDMAQKSS